MELEKLLENAIAKREYFKDRYGMFQLSPSLIAKRYLSINFNDAIKTETLTEKFLNNNINVPQTYGIMEYTPRSSTYYCLIMDIVQGKEFCYLDLDHKKAILPKIQEEIIKILKLNIVPDDLHSENIIITPKDSVFFIDFDRYYYSNNKVIAKQIEYYSSKEYIKDELFDFESK